MSLTLEPKQVLQHTTQLNSVLLNFARVQIQNTNKIELLIDSSYWKYNWIRIN